MSDGTDLVGAPRREAVAAWEGRSTTRRGFLLGSAGLSLGAVLAGCGGSSNGPAAHSGGHRSGGPATTATLLAAISGSPTTLDPVKASTFLDSNAIYNVFEYLYFRDISGATVPRLATSYSLSSDGLAYTFHLRPGVTFHNGESFTADDVAFSFERAVKPALQSQLAYEFSLAGVDVIDSLTARVRLKEPNGDFVNLFGYVAMMPQTYVTQKGDAYFAQNPVGTGPYKVTNFSLNQSLTLSRFENYWGQKPAYETIKVTYITDATTRVAALRSGQVDLADGVQPQNVPSLGQAKVASAGSGEAYTFDFNMLSTTAPYQKQGVRQAIDYAVDKEAIRQNLLQGYALPVVAGLFQGQAGYSESGVTPRPYDPSMAKKLLADAGVAGGFSMSVVGVANGRFIASAEVAQAVGGYLSDVGIKADTQILSYDQWIGHLTRSSDFGPGMVFDGSNVDSYVGFIQGFLPGFSYSHGTDPHITTLYNDLNRATTPSARTAATTAAAQYFHTEATFIDLYSDKAIWAMSPSVSFQPTPYLAGLTLFANASPA